jgi:type IV pilus assembly protein PilW
MRGRFQPAIHHHFIANIANRMNKFMTRNQNYKRVKQRGFTLVELMVAMTISLFLLAAIGLVYMSSKTGFAYANNTVRLGEDAAFALDALSRDIRMAGYAGCLGSSRTPVVPGTYDITTDVMIPKVSNVTGLSLNGDALPNPFSNSVFNAREALVGYDSAAAAAAVASAVGLTSFLANTTSYTVNASTKTAPVLFVAGGSAQGLQLNATVAAGQKIAALGNDTYKWSNSDNGADIMMMIADCKSSEMFRIANISTTSDITSATNFLNDHSADAIVTPLITSTFFLATRSNAPAGTPPSLYRRYFNGKTSMGLTQEIVANVEAISYKYGENTSNIAAGLPNAGQPTYQADVYRDKASDVLDWSRVVSLRIGLIVVTEDANQTSSANPTVQWLGDNTGSTTYTPPNTTDRRLRRAYSTTVSIRNRIGV